MKPWFGLLLIAAVACNSTEQVELAEPDLSAVRGRALNECRAATNSIYAGFKLTSANAFGVYPLWARHTTFKHEYKKTGNATATLTHSVRVWKALSNTIYLAVQKTSEDGSSDRKYFLRLPLLPAGGNGSNEKLIDDIQYQTCIPVSTPPPTDYTEVSGGSGGPITVTRHYVSVNNDGTSRAYTDSYVFDFQFPAWVGSAYRLNRTVVNRDINGTATGTKDEFASTFVQVTTPQTNLPDDHYDGAFVSPGDSNVHFCDVTNPGPDPTYPDLTYVLPFKVPADTDTCSSSLPGAWTNFAI